MASTTCESAKPKMARPVACQYATSALRRAYCAHSIATGINWRSSPPVRGKRRSITRRMPGTNAAPSGRTRLHRTIVPRAERRQDSVNELQQESSKHEQIERLLDASVLHRGEKLP